MSVRGVRLYSKAPSVVCSSTISNPSITGSPTCSLWHPRRREPRPVHPPRPLQSCLRRPVGRPRCSGWSGPPAVGRPLCNLVWDHFGLEPAAPYAMHAQRDAARLIRVVIPPKIYGMMCFPRPKSIHTRAGPYATSAPRKSPGRPAYPCHVRPGTGRSCRCCSDPAPLPHQILVGF